MKFFQPPPGGRRPPAHVPLPEWLGPPPYEAGEPLPAAAVVVARSDSAAVVLEGVTVYSNGLRVALAARVRDADPRVDVLGSRGGPVWELTEVPDTVLRLGVELPDGRRATNLDRKAFPPDTLPAVSFIVSGGGGGAVWDFSAWLWPLPPAEPFDLVCEWPAFSIPETRHPLDGAAIRAAAARSAPLWPG